MIVVDVNLLLYAVFDTYPQHARARAWWEETVSGTTPVALAAPALFGFFRISTNPRIFTSPLSVEQAIGYANEWLAQPNVRYLPGSPRHLEIAFELLQTLGTAGNLTTDVQLAALAMEHGGELHSNDTDFGRFPQLAWVNPLR